MNEKTMYADLTVIGSGGAGMAAAVTAMQNGVEKILVLEKSPFLGGNSRMAGGHLVCVTTDDKPGTVGTAEEVFRETIRFHHYERVEPKILRKFLDNTRATIDWLEEIGIPYLPNGSGMQGAPYPFGNFKRAILRMAELLREQGNTILKNTAATGIERDETGRVCGVNCIDAEGNMFFVKTRAVMIATGGFTGNSELLHQYFPEDYDDNYYTDALPQDGDGILLAESAGAAMTDYCTIIKENAYSCNSRLDAPNRAGHQACSLWVNARGERFHDESDTFSNESTNSLVRQPGRIGYALFDENILSAMENMVGDAQRHGGPMSREEFDPGDRMGGGPGVLNIFDAFSLRDQLENEYQRKEGWVMKADSLEDLAAQLDMDGAILRKTVEDYNRDCDTGHDSLFGKSADALIALNKAPYYALKFRPILIDTIGPIIVNEDMETVDADHRVIPGLYAGGVCTSGSQGRDYTLHGAALGYSLFSGRTAGASIAAYLKKEA